MLHLCIFYFFSPLLWKVSYLKIELLSSHPPFLKRGGENSILQACDWSFSSILYSHWLILKKTHSLSAFQHIPFHHKSLISSSLKSNFKMFNQSITSACTPDFSFYRNSKHENRFLVLMFFLSLKLFLSLLILFEWNRVKEGFKWKKGILN